MFSIGNFVYGLFFDWPVSAVIISLILWFQVKVYMGEIQASNYHVSYDDCIKKKNMHKVFVAPFCHSSHLLALFNLLIIWDLRAVEYSYGSMFYLLYSIILLLFETSFFLYAVKLLSDRSLVDFDISVHWLFMQNGGYNGLVLSWVGFLSIDLLRHNKSVDFYIFSIIPVPVSFAPIVVWLVFQLWSPRHQALSQLGALLGGYLLAFGVLKVLISTYWTICIFFDIFLLYFWFTKYVREVEGEGGRTNGDNANANNDNDDDDNFATRDEFRSGGAFVNVLGLINNDDDGGGGSGGEGGNSNNNIFNSSSSNNNNENSNNSNNSDNNNGLGIGRGENGDELLAAAAAEEDYEGSVATAGGRAVSSNGGWSTFLDSNIVRRLRSPGTDNPYTLVANQDQEGAEP